MITSTLFNLFLYVLHFRHQQVDPLEMFVLWRLFTWNLRMFGFERTNKFVPSVVFPVEVKMEIFLVDLIPIPTFILESISQQINLNKEQK